VAIMFEQRLTYQEQNIATIKALLVDIAQPVVEVTPSEEYIAGIDLSAYQS